VTTHARAGQSHGTGNAAMTSFKGEKRYLPPVIEVKPAGEGYTVFPLSCEGPTRPAREQFQ
jgi:hypothetical protein